MQILLTLAQLAAIWAGAWLMGLAAVKALLPEDLEREHGTLVAPTVGYLVFCFLAFSLSASFKIAAESANLIVAAFLALAGLATQLRPAWRVRPRELGRDLLRSLLLVLPMAVVTLGPLFWFGAETYLGAVNPDYFAGMLDNFYLSLGNSVATFGSLSRDTHLPIDYVVGHLSLSARFGAGVFGILVHQLLGVPQRTALTLVIGFFMLSLPLTLHFFCRVAMGLQERPARLAAWLIGVAGPIAMSYLYFYVGQNSGMPALPLLLGVCYLMLMRPDWRTLLLAALLANALFVNYFAMLPYALAPTGALGLYLLATRRLPVGRAAAMALVFAGVTVVAKLGNVADTIASLRAWMNVIGQSLQGQFFLEFLTPSFFGYFFGVVNYPTNPIYTSLLGPALPFVGAAISVCIAVVVIECVRRWTVVTREAAMRVFILSALVIYALVWARYTFPQQYGYAVFKMSSWLQFILVPFIAFGWFDLRERLGASRGRGALRTAGFAAALCVCAAYVMLNVASCLRYDYNGAGRNTRSGLIVNHFGTAGNLDYFALGDALRSHVKPEESVGLLFTDAIRDYWTAYYTRGVRESILSHEALPGDDENLPDVQTDVVVDYYGNLRRDENQFFHGASDDYILTWGTTDLNQDIVTPIFAGPPVWENASFRLYRASDARDILFTGRGYYRLENFDPVAEYFFPRVLRWSADGGELHLLRPSHPGGEYRIAFDAMVGYEYPKDSRTIEVWIDKRKVEEIVLRHSGRIVTAPFRPDDGVHKIVLRIRERNRPLPRDIPIWNRDIPKDYRRLNVGFFNVRLLTPDTPPPPPVPLGKRLQAVQLMESGAERFNGLQLDGWLGEDAAEISMRAPEGASKLRIEGFVPGNVGFSFPYLLRIAVGTHAEERRIEAPGAFTVEVPLAGAAGTTSLVLTPTQSVDLHQEAIRHKTVRQSVRLDAVAFE